MENNSASTINLLLNLKICDIAEKDEIQFDLEVLSKVDSNAMKNLFGKSSIDGLIDRKTLVDTQRTSIKNTILFLNLLVIICFLVIIVPLIVDVWVKLDFRIYIVSAVTALICLFILFNKMERARNEIKFLIKDSVLSIIYDEIIVLLKLKAINISEDSAFFTSIRQNYDSYVGKLIELEKDQQAVNVEDIANEVLRKFVDKYIPGIEKKHESKSNDNG